MVREHCAKMWGQGRQHTGRRHSGGVGGTPAGTEAGAGGQRQGKPGLEPVLRCVPSWKGGVRTKAEILPAGLGPTSSSQMWSRSCDKYLTRSEISCHHLKMTRFETQTPIPGFLYKLAPSGNVGH